MRVSPQNSPFVYSTLESHGALALPIAEEPSLAGQTIVVATDGTQESRAATAVASVLGRRHGATTVALRAYDFTAPNQRAETIVAPWGRTYDTLDIARHLLRAEINRDIAEVETWNVRAVAGRPAHAIAAEARALDAALVVMGLRRARHGSDAPHHDTVLRVMRESSAPVLVTTGALAGAPKRIVVGVDFGLESVRLARAALTVLDDDGELVLANVQSQSKAGGGIRRRDGARMDESAAASLERLRRALPSWTNVTLEVLHERDDVATSLLSAAVRLRADCIAVGSRSHAFDDGARLGPVASALVESGMRSLLVVPSAHRGAAAVSAGHGS
jgi:nucleotide-binding universal stress UspA family protein